jgi:xylulokinase
MKKKRLTIGLDISTQSISAAVLDIDARSIMYEHSINYLKDARLNIYGIRKEDYLLPPENEGEASQPALMFFAALDAIFSDLKKTVNMADIVAVNSSGQQHGHIYLNSRAKAAFQSLLDDNSAKSNLVSLLKDSLAYERAPIWMTADTAEQADFIRRKAGDKKKLIELSGSNAPLRFTGIVIRKIGERHPEIYRLTENIQLISSLTAAVMTGNSKVPLDFGNCCGTSLMDYRQKKWSDILIKAASDGLPGGEKDFKNKLPDIVSPDAVVGKTAPYFVKKFGFSPACLIIAGSGDNPQSKVCVPGDLLSLGSSIVNMVSTDGLAFDLEGYANAMYDGIGRPFMFGCRTNGALVWDALRAKYGLKKDDFRMAEESLRQITVGQNLVFWQPRSESFPVSPVIELTRNSDVKPGFNADYSGLIESTLSAVYRHSRGFTKTSQEPLYVTGGAQNSPEILRRVAAIWQRPVIATEEGGAALGAAIAAAGAIFCKSRRSIKIEDYASSLLKRKSPFFPAPVDIKAFHQPGGYLEKFAREEAKLFNLQILIS